MKLTYFGQNGFHFTLKGYDIVVDPFITHNPKNEVTSVQDIKADFILLTHGHEDHVADVAEIANNNNNSKLISNYEVITWFEGKELNGHPMNHGGKFSFPFGTVKYVHAVHSSTMPDGKPGGNPGGFVIWNEDICFYIAGDTALTMDMKLIPLTCPKLDFAILPIGDNFTMGYEDAVIASDFIECNNIVGCHYDTFGYIEVDHQVAKEAFSKAGKKLTLISIGGSEDIGK